MLINNENISFLCEGISNIKLKDQLGIKKSNIFSNINKNLICNNNNNKDKEIFIINNEFSKKDFKSFDYNNERINFKLRLLKYKLNNILYNKIFFFNYKNK